MSSTVRDDENMGRQSRPSLGQVKAVIEFMQKHPDLANNKLRQIMNHEKLKKMWIEMSNIANSVSGATKSTKGWIKYWSDKRRCVMVKQRHIQTGKTKSRLTPLEKKILNICTSVKASKKKKVKHEPLIDDDQLIDSEYSKSLNGVDETSKIWPTEADERHMNMIEKMAEVMNKQATALTQIAQASHIHSNSMERLANASYQQALAVDRLSNTFQSIGTALFDVGNAVINIDYIMKRCLTGSATQHRQNTNLFT